MGPQLSLASSQKIGNEGYFVEPTMLVNTDQAAQVAPILYFNIANRLLYSSVHNGTRRTPNGVEAARNSGAASACGDAESSTQLLAFIAPTASSVWILIALR